MPLDTLNLLFEEVQLAPVYREGTYIARRWDDVHQAVLLYRVPAGFSVALFPEVADPPMVVQEMGAHMVQPMLGAA